jgi:hypothetical protein
MTQFIHPLGGDRVHAALSDVWAGPVAGNGFGLPGEAHTGKTTTLARLLRASNHAALAATTKE